MTTATQADLQAALNGGGTVVFGTGGTITLTNTLTIAQDTVIDANGFAVTISGGNAVRLFEVNSNVAFSVNGLTLANGYNVGADGSKATPPEPGQDGSGAGIFNLGGTVALTGCALTNHSAQGGHGGRVAPYSSSNGGNGLGAAICSQGGTLNLTNCLLAGNSTTGGTAYVNVLGYSPGVNGQGLGGAIYCADGQLNLQGVTLQTNSAAGSGGGIYATHSEVVLSGSALEGNNLNGAVGAGLGGALFLDYGSSGLIQLSRFLGNEANGIGGSVGVGVVPGESAHGGAVFSGAYLEISDSTFSSNSCMGSLASQPGGGVGGAICSTNTLVINGCTFDNNKASGGGTGCGETIEVGAPAEGGGVWASGLLAATNSTFTANQAIGGVGSNGGGLGPPKGPGGAASGGAMYLATASATLVNLTIAANGASGTSGGCDGAAGPAQGGGLCSTNAGILVFNTIIANSPSGGDVWGAVIDGGYNICSDGTAAFSATGSLNRTNPLVGPLADNGGPTETMALLPGSPALNAIPSGFPPVDQCGTSRPQGLLADIGAFEAVGQSTQTTIVLQPAGATDPAGDNVVFTVSATGSGSLSYQWYKDGAPIGGATNSSFTLTNVQASDAGAYSVAVGSNAGRTLSESAVLAVDPPAVAAVDPRDLQWRFSGTTNNLHSAAYGGGTLVVVGEGGTILSSTDTVTWSKRQAGTTAGLYGVAFGNGVFVAVGGTTNTEILTSPDGIVWTAQSAAEGSPLKAVAWGANTFVAVGEQGTILVSTNGRVWNQRSTGLSNTLDAVTVGTPYFNPASGGGGPLFVAVGEQGVLLTSPDGFSWTVGNSGTPLDLYCVAYVQGDRPGTVSFLAAGTQGTAVVSSDGVNWTAAALPTNLDVYAAGGSGAFGNGAVGQYAVAGGGGAFLTSTDGSAWSMPASGTTANLRGLLPLSGEFLAVGDGGAIRCGLVFLQRDSHVSVDLYSVAWGDGTYVAVGDSGTVVSSANGGPWVAAQLGTNNLYGVAYGDGRFVAVGGGGTVLVSTNGHDWTPAASPPAPEAASFVLGKVTYGNRAFIASGYSSNSAPDALPTGLLAVSPDGSEWNIMALPPGYETSLNGALCAGPDVFVVPGTNLLTSADGRTWIDRVPGVQFPLVAYGSSHYLALNGGSAATSSDGTNWNVAALSGSEGFSGLAWGQGSFLAAGSLNGVPYLAESTNGVNWISGVLSAPLPFGVGYGGDSFVIVGYQGLILQSAPRVSPSQLQIVLSGSNATLAVISEPNKPVLLQSSTDFVSWDAGLTLTPTNSITYLPVSTSPTAHTFFRLVTQ